VLARQYRSWFALEQSDAMDVAFGLSAMHLVRQWISGGWPNWPAQLVGTLVLLLPLALRRSAWSDREFRLGFLASVLMYAVLFNHQAERPSFVIATAGVAIWCVTPPRGTSAVWLRAALALTAVVGLKTAPLLVVWLIAQGELYGWRIRHLATHGIAPNDGRIDRLPRGGAAEDAA
jgi:hypothetical protein